MKLQEMAPPIGYRLSFLREFYGPEALFTFDKNLFEAVAKVVEEVRQKYAFQNLSFKKGNQGVAVLFFTYQRIAILNRQFEAITSCIGLSRECSTREDLREMFPLPVFDPSCQEAVAYESSKIYRNLASKSLDFLAESIWAPEPLRALNPNI